MGWLDEVWQQRQPFTDGFEYTPGTFSFQIQIPASWDTFWDVIDASGDELRITEADGVTPIAYTMASFSVANRTGTITLDQGSLPTSGVMYVRYLYFDSTSAQGSGTGSITLGTPLAMSAFFADIATTSYAMRAEHPIPGQTEPLHVFAIPVANAQNPLVAVDMDGVLLDRPDVTGGHLNYEEVAEVTLSSVDDTGAAATVATLVRDARLSEHDGRRVLWVPIYVPGATDGTNYTVYVNVLTAVPDDTLSFSPGHLVTFGIDAKDLLNPAP